MHLRLSERGVRSEPVHLMGVCWAALSPSDQPAQAAQAPFCHMEEAGASVSNRLQKPAVPQSRPPVDVIAGLGVINQESG